MYANFCSQVDLELDFLAPFLVKHGGVEAMTRKVALQVRNAENAGEHILDRNADINSGEGRMLGEYQGKHGGEGAGYDEAADQAEAGDGGLEGAGV